jgi:hypothetical protein
VERRLWATNVRYQDIVLTMMIRLTVSIDTVTIPSGFSIHPGDVILLARYGYSIRVREIAAKLGFQDSVAQEVYEQVSGLREMEQVLRTMQDAAKRCGEERIGRLVAGDSDDLDTDSES